MVPSDFRLDTVAAHLVERLEGVRRSFIDEPERARLSFAEIARDFAGDAARECREYVDDAEYPQILVREVSETFLPRYSRLAVAHNALEREGYGAWRGGDPLARIGVTAVALVLATVLSRIFPSPLVVFAWIVAVAMPFMPEIRGAWYRMRYQRELQAAVDDMGRIHEQLDVYRSHQVAILAAEQAPVASQSTGHEKHIRQAMKNSSKE